MSRALLFLLGALALAGCKKKGFHPPGHHETVLQRVRALKKTPKPPKFRGHKHPDGLVQMRWKRPARRFFTTARVPHLKRFPCQKCHQKGIAMKGHSSLRFRLTHGTIQLKHAAQGVLQCSSCHDPKRMDRLRLPSGRHVSFDRVALLCSSCHSKQAQDWAGGSHGKRLRYWGGKRVLFNCTQCHDPHQPLKRFGKRWPKAHVRLPQKR